MFEIKNYINFKFYKKWYIESVNIFKIDIRFTLYLFPFLTMIKLKKDEIVYR